MNDFVLSYPTTIYFGEGSLKKAFAAEMSGIGKTVMLAYGSGSIKKSGLHAEIRLLLEAAGKEVVDFAGIMPNPTYAKVQEGARLARERKVDFIVAAGGGSVMDCAKIIAMQAELDEDIWEMEKTKKEMPKRGIPFCAVLTASGTGAEQNGIAVITHEEKKLKEALMGKPAVFAVLDPLLTRGVPMRQVFSGAFDTLSHCMEEYFGTPVENNLTDDMNEAVMRSVIRNVRLLEKDPMNMEARGELIWASAMAENGILKLGKSSSFVAHPIEHQLGAYTDCNHGVGLAVLQPILYRMIYKGGLPRFARFAVNVWGIDPANKTEEEKAVAGLDALAAFIREMGLPASLREMGITDKSCFEKVAASSTIRTGCFSPITRELILELLNKAY